MKKGKKAINQAFFFLDYIPPELIAPSKELLHEAELEKKKIEEKKRLKEMYTFTIHLGKIEDVDRPWRLKMSSEFKELRLHKTDLVSTLTQKAAELWGITDLKDEKFRIKKYNSDYKLGLESYEG